jgi:hypothetical protein
MMQPTFDYKTENRTEEMRAGFTCAFPFGVIENILVPCSNIYQYDSNPLLDRALNPTLLRCNLCDLLAAGRLAHEHEPNMCKNLDAVISQLTLIRQRSPPQTILVWGSCCVRKSTSGK